MWNSLLTLYFYEVTLGACAHIHVCVYVFTIDGLPL